MLKLVTASLGYNFGFTNPNNGNSAKLTAFFFAEIS